MTASEEDPEIAAGAPLPVLMYHALGTPLPGRLAGLSVPASLFAEQLDALREAGWALLGLTDALEARRRGVRAIAVTIDDGFLDFCEVGMGALAAAGAGATLYVPTHHLGRTASWLPGAAAELRLMDAGQVRAAAADGIEIGSHGHRHLPLDALPISVVSDEVRRSRHELQAISEQAVPSFCYPHGYHDARVRRVVAAAGHETATAIGHRLHPVGGDPWSVARVRVGPEHRAEDVVALAEHGPAPWGPAVRRVLTPPWRVARRAVRATTGKTWT